AHRARLNHCAEPTASLGEWLPQRRLRQNGGYVATAPFVVLWPSIGAKCNARASNNETTMNLVCSEMTAQLGLRFEAAMICEFASRLRGGGLSGIAMLEIGRFYFDEASRELGCGAAVRRISPKAAGVLIALAQTPGRVWSRAAILERVWPQVIVGEEVLTH